MKEQFAVVYRRRGKLIFGTQGRTTAGVLVGSEPPSVVDAHIDAAAIGSILRATLEKSYLFTAARERWGSGWGWDAGAWT
jgi:hypothetical protein